MEQTGTEFLMTASKYNEEVKSWTLRVRGASVNILATHTHSSGALRRRIEARTRMDKDRVYVNALGFRFLRYGAFRAYGAGRGYVVKDGVIVRGHSAWSDETRRNDLRKRGEKDKDIRKMKRYVPYGVIKRSPLDWLDKPIERNINELADIAGEYHGDAALKDVLNQFNKITIKKNYGKR